MNKIVEYDSFYKFLVSFGIILIFSPFIVFYFFFKNNDVLLITTNEFNTLTENAQNIIESKQIIFGQSTIPVLIICMIFLIIGITLLCLGCMNWNKTQKLLNNKQLLENKQLEVVVKKLTNAEIIEKTSTEINESEIEIEIKAEGEGERVIEVNNKSENQSEIDINTENIVENKEIQGNSERINNIDLQLFSNITANKVLEYTKIEENAYKYISKKYAKTHTLQNNVKIHNIAYDIIATASLGYIKDFFVEIKYYNTPFISKQRFQKICQQINYNKQIYDEYTGKKIMPILYIIISDEYYDILKIKIQNYISISNEMNIRVEIVSETDMNNTAKNRYIKKQRDPHI